MEEFQFESEMEFFLHFLWSSRGYHIEDNSDEYYNLRNTQSTLAIISKPESSATAHRNSHWNKSSDPTFYRKQRQDYSNRVPISFNFQIP